ncbi:hypothetical protein HDU87_001792 [Geranomyces variabilis]|uniref:RING-type domain-containing protein n=1 Tax=Geranomyces variabilis TaxID=109894 RepID=A0AAD5XP58_9FUNG|nr:hypothetical protein HDU87_001792 [Geranomyces variabilis]
MIGSWPATATAGGSQAPTTSFPTTILQPATTSHDGGDARVVAKTDTLAPAAPPAELARPSDLLPAAPEEEGQEEEDAELLDLPSSPTGSVTGGQLHRRARPLKRSSRSKSRERRAERSQEARDDESGLRRGEEQPTVLCPSDDEGKLLQAWSAPQGTDDIRASFIVTEEGVELGQSAVVDMPKVQSAQEVYTVNIPLEPSDPVQISKSVEVTLENGETFVVSNGTPEATSVTVTMPSSPSDVVEAAVLPTSPRIPPRCVSPLPVASLQKPLPPLPITVAPTTTTTTTTTIPIPVRMASKLPVTAQWVQPTPISIPDNKLSARPTLFKKRPSTVSEASPVVESPVTNGRSSDEFSHPPTPALMDRSLSSDGSTSDGVFSPRASVEAVVDFEGGVISASSNLRSTGSVRSLFRKRPGISVDSVGASASEHPRELSPTSPSTSRKGLDLPPGTAFAADANNGNGASQAANSANEPALSTSPSSLSMAEMLAPPTAQQIVEIVGPAMQSFQMRQTDPLAPGTYSVVANELAVPVTQSQPGVSVTQAFVEAGFASRAAPAAGRVSHYVPREYPTDVPAQPSQPTSPPVRQLSSRASVIIAPRISSLGTARREDVSRKRFTYLGGENLAAASYLKPILQRPDDAGTAFVPLDPREVATCPLCADICERAVRLSCCENVCCSSCIWRWLANRTTCPFCRTRIAPENVAPAPEVQEVIDRLTVKCKVTDCGWEGLRSDLKAHVTNTPEHLVPDRPSFRVVAPFAGKNYVHRRSTDFSHHRRSLSVRHNAGGDTRTLPRMQELFAPDMQPSQLQAIQPLPFTLNRSSGSRRIHIPLRSAHPRIMFRRISGYGSPSGFVKTIHANASAPCIGIPPRVASAVLGLPTPRLGLPPLEDGDDDDDAQEEKNAADSDPPTTARPPSDVPDAPTDEVTLTATIPAPTTGAAWRTRTSASTSSSSRRSSTYSTRRSAYASSRRTSRHAGETSWDLIPDEADLGNALHTAAAAAGTGTGTGARRRETQRSSRSNAAAARSSGSSSGRSRRSTATTTTLSKLAAADEDWQDVEGNPDSDDGNGEADDGVDGAAGSATLSARLSPSGRTVSD